MHVSRDDSDREDHGSSLQERAERLDEWLEVPLALLGLVWLGVIIVELWSGASGWTQWLSFGIWGIFLVEFAVRFVVAADKLEFLQAHRLDAASLVVPVLRVFTALRVLRAFTAFRSVQLMGLVTTFGKVKDATRRLVRESGHRYVPVLTVLVTFGGAAGMYGFEGGPHSEGFETYGDALWWTAMLITTIGSQYWPTTSEGRVLALLLSGYSLGVLGYITAALSSFLIGSRAAPQRQAASDERALEALRGDIAQLAAEVQRLAQRESQKRSSDEG
jgi:voltage-gated potassium channel